MASQAWTFHPQVNPAKATTVTSKIRAPRFIPKSGNAAQWMLKQVQHDGALKRAISN